MKKLLVFGVIVLFLSVSVIPSTGTTDVKQITMPTSSGNTLYVGGSGPNNYTKIQDAIDDASDGDTVFVYDDSSPYYEHVVIGYTKSINLVGEDRNTTVIDGGGNGHVVEICEPEVNISGFTIQNSGHEMGHDLVRGSGIVILGHLKTRTIFDNNIVDNYCGISLYCSWYNIIYGNKISANVYGIHISPSLGFSSKNKIYGNIIKNNHYGIRFDSPDDNNIFHNDFINNIQHAYDYWENTWDDGYPSGGNYWDDYIGTDGNNDGIGDSPYDIPGDRNQDGFPLIEPKSNDTESISVKLIKSRLGVTFGIKNVGHEAYIDLPWEIGLYGGIILWPLDRGRNGIIPIVPVGSEIQKTVLVFGLGPVIITVTVRSTMAKAEGFFFGPFVFIREN